jgi:hypothetical protein
MQKHVFHDVPPLKSQESDNSRPVSSLGDPFSRKREFVESKGGQASRGRVRAVGRGGQLQSDCAVRDGAEQEADGVWVFGEKSGGGGGNHGTQPSSGEEGGLQEGLEKGLEEGL